MTPHEKKMKAAAIAVSYFVQENQNEKTSEKAPAWGRMGAKMAMSKREFIQRKGKGLWIPK
ncbi:MAG: hypothetical protein PHW35_05745 [Lentimicrobiaceae bacterium]|mgnify:CR=1 FL=1|jgi:hypothetical protein|nr:hypothetical protein [Lentimicrobiaceae bacterium]MDD4597450.1 hypothetical protein [Lentimicrobiaceae bacterium]MDY0026021.1 hypothetical protein [Lentimicrobium sp.]HAH59929.1 hypothetical protein [Bacteroidales bacterium]